jgi:hypothetical protein
MITDPFPDRERPIVDRTAADSVSLPTNGVRRTVENGTPPNIAAEGGSSSLCTETDSELDAGDPPARGAVNCHSIGMAGLG